MPVNLSTTYLGLELESPVIVASSGLTESVELMAKAQKAGAGAVVMKSLFEEEVCRQAPSPRYRIIDHGMEERDTFTFFSYEQASEWGPERYAEEVSRAVKELDLKVLPSINCLKIETWVKWAKMMEDAGAHAIELNTSCPHGSITFRGGEVEETITGVVEAVRKAVSIPIAAKISPMLTNPLGLIKMLAGVGVDGVTIFNRMTALDIDLDREAPIMHGSYAGHGGPWAMLYPLRWISAVRPQVQISISGSGGVSSGRDLAKYILVGADAVQVCTAIYLNGFGIITALLSGLAGWMEEKGYGSLGEFRGKVNRNILSTEEVDRSKKVHAEIDATLSPPCRAACPDGVHAQGYVRLASMGRFEEAFALIKEHDPFQRTLGYICNHFCEQECTRQKVDSPIAIRDVKRAVLEWGLEAGLEKEVEKAPANGRKAAVLGSGPAGLAAAWELAIAGYEVAVFEKREKAGGLLRYGIPRFRLPEAVVDYDVQRVLDLGVELRTGSEVKDARRLLDEYDGVVMAVGASEARGLGVSGEGLEGVVDALELICMVPDGQFTGQIGRIAVLGGGNSAVDAARTALRLGAKTVYLVYRRSRAEMPALAEEIAAAEVEGVRVLTEVAPVEIAGDGRVERLRLAPLYLGEEDSSGRRRPVNAEDAAPFDLEVDMVVSALGQGAPDRAACVDMRGGEKDERIVFAGDCRTGASSVVEAVASGRRAAAELDRAVRGGDATLSARPADVPVVKGDVLARLKDWKPEERIEARAVEPKGLETLCQETLSIEKAAAEGSRCLACGCGTGCDRCLTVCLHDAVRAVAGRNHVDAEECEGCGLCMEVCPNENIRLVPREG